MYKVKIFLLIIALLFSTAITSGCTVNKFNEEISQSLKTEYVSVKETVFFRQYLAITPEEKFQLIKTKSNKKFVAKLDGEFNYGVNENLCLNGTYLSIDRYIIIYHPINDEKIGKKRMQKLFGKIPCFSIVE